MLVEAYKSRQRITMNAMEYINVPVEMSVCLQKRE